MSAILPWQTSNWQNLTSSQQNKRLAHGLLFHGAKGTGKMDFAINFAHWLLCEQPLADKACGQCKACLLVKAESNPDLLYLCPEEEGKAIKVDQIRELINKISLTCISSTLTVISEPFSNLTAVVGTSFISDLIVIRVRVFE